MRSPGQLIKSMWRDLLRSRELAWRLFIRDVNAQYRQSLFGVVWAFIPPIITSLIFIFLNSRRVITFGDVGIPYPAFVLVGTILWQLFSESLNAPLKSVTLAQPLLAKVNFPREALILSAFYLVIFNALIKSVVLAGVVLLFGLQPAWGVVLAPLLILAIIVLGISLGLLVTPLGLLYTDVTTSLPIIVQLLFFVTPVVYPPPQTFPFSLIGVLNPISPFIIAGRDLITLGTISNLTEVLIVSGLILVLLFVSWIIYRVALPILIERISA
jgi:lipopolysaccharide transport system permease protein